MKTRDVYNQFAAQYHQKRTDPAQNLSNEHLDFPAVRALIGDRLQGRRVIDLGCGSGLFSARFHALGASVHGVDLSEEMIEIARRDNPGSSFDVADVTNTGLPAGVFDVAISCLVAHYLSDVEPFFREAARLLRRPEGKFIFSFHHPINEVIDREGDQVLLKPYFHNEAYQWQMLDGMMLESHHHTFEQIIGALFRAGFVVEEMKESRPAEDLAEPFPDFYRFTSKYPTFCAIRAALR